MLYIDTSILVCALTNEADTGTIQTWLSQQDSRELTISDWVTTDFSSALSIKLRTGHLGVEHRAAALSAFTRLVSETLTIIPVSRSSFQTAARFADQHSLNLRAGDALHLAICAEHGARLCTLDRRLSEAATLVGVESHLL
jgi:predicted nucleic acid-binding protein